MSAAPMPGRASQSADDLELIAAMAAGDQSALSALYDKHCGVVFSLCLRVLRDRADAEDVQTEVFHELWVRARDGRYEVGRGSPLTYLLTLARSRSIDRQRSKASRPTVALDSGTADSPMAMDRVAPAAGGLTPLATSELTEQRELVRRALSDLDPAQRQAIECSFYDNLSHSEIAERLKKPLGTVKTYIRQGLIRMRDQLRID